MHEFHPSQSPDGSIWMEFINVETADGRTFSPLQYLVASRRGTPSPDNFETWEDFYGRHPNFVGYDLLHIVKTYPQALAASGELEPAIESIFRAAEISPAYKIYSDQTPGSRNDLLASLFWACADLGRGYDCMRILWDYGHLFSQESMHYMRFAVGQFESDQ